MKSDKKDIPTIQVILFKGKQNICWNDVELYLKRYIGHRYIVKESQDCIQIAGDFPEEYAESKYTKSLRGAVAKAKANAAQIIDELIINASNRRWVENKKEKHQKDASDGWYRYDTHFQILANGGEGRAHWNYYEGTLIVRKASWGLFLYDIINIKKEASTPLES